MAKASARFARIEATLSDADLWFNPASGQYERTTGDEAENNWSCETEGAAGESGLTVKDLAWFEGQAEEQGKSYLQKKTRRKVSARQKPTKRTKATTAIKSAKKRKSRK